MIESVEIIKKDSALSVSEKLARIDKLLANYTREIKDAKCDLLKDYTYCHKCQEYYLKTEWKTGILYVQNQPIADEKMYIECPKGHKIIDNYDC
jgi:hypothetical protein